MPWSPRSHMQNMYHCDSLDINLGILFLALVVRHSGSYF